MPSRPEVEPDWALVRRPLGQPGRPLDPTTRARLGERLGRDFSAVRVHDDVAASSSARAVDATAFTVGHHVVFDRGRYEPGTAAGDRLLAHELTHVVQQAGHPIPSGPLPIVAHDAPSEREAAMAGSEHTGSLECVTRGAERAVIQRTPTGPTPNPRTICEPTSNASSPPRPDDCWYREPRNCPAYEDWIASFTSLRTFAARTTPTRAVQPSGPHTFSVIGGGPARRYGGPANEPASADPTGSERLGEAFVDHPTDDWVRQCLPANLRATAYQLPSDCADIAVILRHVWLAAHRRTERFGGFVIGDRAGEAAQARVGSIIAKVGTGNVATMVNPYSDGAGRALRTFRELEPLLHVGDILVWAHFDNAGGYGGGRSGGHTHTISRIDRDASGHILSIGALQGNLPIFGTAGRPGDDKGAIIQQLGRRDTPAIREALGVAPGRRIEAATLTSGNLHDNNVPLGPNGLDVWEWHAGTILVAAGPPKAAGRPRAQRGAGGARQPLQLMDWVPSLTNATGNTIIGVWEAMLVEARRFEEGGQPIATEDARRVGEVAGTRVWRLAATAARASNALSSESQFARRRAMRAMLSRIRAGATAAAGVRVRAVLTEIDDAFTLAASGASDIMFGGPTRATDLRFLLTGFDPFRSDLRQPGPGEWNPSAEAVMRLDGQTVRVPRGRRPVNARLEGVVLPVDFDAFRGGIVERIVRPRLSGGGALDAVLTVSQGTHSQSPAGPLRIERYAAGVRDDPRPNQGLGPVPAAPGGSLGPAIIESSADVTSLQAQLPTRAVGGVTVQQPGVGEDITFEFTDVLTSVAAQTALGLTAQRAARVVISNERAIQRIMATMRRMSNGVDLEFRAGGRSFRTRLLRGPGGDFLSNEVSYRVLRAAAGGRPVSFHLHTPQGTAIRAVGQSGPGGQTRGQDLASARSLVAHVVVGLRRIVEATARQILDRRTPPPSSNP